MHKTPLSLTFGYGFMETPTVILQCVIQMGKKNTVEKNTQITKLKVLIWKKHILNSLLSSLSHQTDQFGDYKCTDIVKQEERL